MRHEPMGCARATRRGVNAMKRRLIVLGCVISVLAMSAACGSRGSLDFELYDQSSGIYALDGSTTGPDSATTHTDGGGPGKPDSAGNPAIVCGTCVTNQCGKEVVGCVSNTGCRDILQCALLNCLQGGMDPTCLFKCASGNPTGALQATQVLQCVTKNCGDSCLTALGGGGIGGMGGGAGGNGGGGGGRGGPPGSTPAHFR